MGKKGLRVRPLQTGELGAYSRLASEHGCIFHTISWTGLFEPAIRRIGIFDDGGDLRGGFCVWEQRKFGLRILRNPPFTPDVGPFFEFRASNAAARTNEQRAVVEAMVEYLSRSNAAVISLGLSLGITDCLPFYWRGWKVVPHYTYRIDLAQNEDMLFAAMSSERRNDVRKSRADSIVVDETTGILEMRALVMATYDRQEMSFPPPCMDLIFSAFSPGENNSCCLIAQANGRPVAGVYMVHDARTAYYLIGGYADGAHHGAGALAIWSAILKAKELGLEVFDFEGSVIPPIERYFRGFGGVLTPVFSVHKAWLPLEMALKLRGRYRNRF